MKHLREQGIVHRDLKPGNIMRFYKEDGRYMHTKSWQVMKIYKIMTPSNYMVEKS